MIEQLLKFHKIDDITSMNILEEKEGACRSVRHEKSKI